MNDRIYRRLRAGILSHGWLLPGQEDLVMELVGRALLGDKVGAALAADLLLDAGRDAEEVADFARRVGPTAKALRSRKRFTYEEAIEFWRHFPGAPKPRRRKGDTVAA